MPHPPRTAPGLTQAPDAAARLGHLCTADDPLVAEMLQSYHDAAAEAEDALTASVRVIDTTKVAPLRGVVAVGGSLTSMPNPLAPQKVLGYVKVAAVYVDGEQIERLKAPVVNPESIRRVLSAHADAQATAVPIGNVRIPGRTLMESVRHALRTTFERMAGGTLYDTLDWLVSCRWDPDAGPWRADSRDRPHLACPLCDGRTPYPRHAREFRCRACGQGLTLVDYLGLLGDASESSSDSAVAMNLSGVLQHLALMTYLRRAVERGVADRVLLVRDGPLMLRGRCTRLTAFIRGYLHHLAAAGVPFHMAGVEREGAFASHAKHMDAWFRTEGGVFLPDNRYILELIKHAGGGTTVYGEKGLYGSKAYYRVDRADTLVLSLPNRRHDFEAFAADPAMEDLVGLERVLATVKSLSSRHFPGVPLPVVAVDRLCSLPQFPANDLLVLIDRLAEVRVEADPFGPP